MASTIQPMIGEIRKDIDKGFVNIGEVWKEIDKIFCNINGVWKEGWSSSIKGILHVTYVTNSNFSIYLYNTSGVLQISKTNISFPNGESRVEQCLLSPDGFIFILTLNASTNNYYFYKYDLSGNRLLSVTNGVAHYKDFVVFADKIFCRDWQYTMKVLDLNLNEITIGVTKHGLPVAVSEDGQYLYFRTWHTGYSNWWNDISKIKISDYGTVWTDSSAVNSGSSNQLIKEYQGYLWCNSGGMASQMLYVTKVDITNGTHVQINLNSAYSTTNTAISFAMRNYLYEAIPGSGTGNWGIYKYPLTGGASIGQYLQSSNAWGGYYLYQSSENTLVWNDYSSNKINVFNEDLGRIASWNSGGNYMMLDVA